MKTNKILLVACLFSILSFNSFSQTNGKSFIIEGQFFNTVEGDVILEQARNLNRKSYEVVDTIEINAEGRFFQNYDLEPGYYRIHFFGDQTVNLVADYGQKIHIKFYEDKKTEITGSEDTDLFLAYEKFRSDVLKTTVYPVRRQLSKLRKENNPDEVLIEHLGSQQLAAESRYRDTLIHFVKKMGSSIAVYPTIIRWTGDDNIAFYDSLARAITQRHGNIEAAAQINEKVRLMKQISIGGKATNIEGPDISGINVSLFQSMGKYTLIDFWASWCAPCRTESQLLRQLYDQYHDQGFQIYGMAFERNKEGWTKALEKDQRSWPNVSELKRYKTEAAFEYSVTSLPKNFILDENGTIIAKDIHGTDLQKLIASLFGN